MIASFRAPTSTSLSNLVYRRPREADNARQSAAQR